MFFSFFLQLLPLPHDILELVQWHRLLEHSVSKIMGNLPFSPTNLVHLVGKVSVTGVKGWLTVLVLRTVGAIVTVILSQMTRGFRNGAVMYHPPPPHTHTHTHTHTFTITTTTAHISPYTPPPPKLWMILHSTAEVVDIHSIYWIEITSWF